MMRSPPRWSPSFLLFLLYFCSSPSCSPVYGFLVVPQRTHHHRSRGATIFAAEAAPTSGPRVEHLFVFGAGYTGQWFCKAARELESDGVRISASTRSRSRADGLEASGLVDDAHVFDLDDSYSGLDAAGCEALAAATHVLVTCPPVADFDRDPLLALHGDLLRASERLRWVGYLSTTGVYGNHDGAWVDEDSETLRGVGSGRPAVRARLAAEAEWLDQKSVRVGWSDDSGGGTAEEQGKEQNEGGLPVHVFRLAGIYGPGRSALDTVRRGVLKQQQQQRGVDEISQGGESGGLGRPAVEPSGDAAAEGEKAVQWVSRIHVEDICGALLASVTAWPSKPSAVYNLADDRPAPRQEVLGFAAELLLAGDLESDELDAAAVEAFVREAASGATVRATSGERMSERRLRALNKENKRVGNKRLRADLGYDLSYPTYAEGLRAISKREREE